jgi:hypothetical protein
LLNNKIGRAIGEKESHNTMNNLACEVLKAFHEQGLYVVKKDVMVLSMLKNRKYLIKNFMKKWRF